MKRRAFIKGAAGSAGAALAAPAIVRGQEQVKWRLTSSFPKSLDTLYGASEHVAGRVSAATGGKFDIRAFAAGEIVPALGVVDALQQGSIECAHTAPYYFYGKDATFASTPASRMA
jgi:TRAP-type mannitol/chloroaromatic compound transport system substrate-binding protein